MKVALACDHGGYELKEFIKKLLAEQDVSVEDFGSHDPDPVDYPDTARPAVRSILHGRNDRGILICGTGLGMSITANRYPGIRGTLCHNEYTAEMARKHNDSNVLILGGRVTPPETAGKILRIWLETPFEGGRHARRIGKIDAPPGTRDRGEAS